jgi:ABC-type amino acid transport substrate-binding protein
MKGVWLESIMRNELIFITKTTSHIGRCLLMISQCLLTVTMALAQPDNDTCKKLTVGGSMGMFPVAFEHAITKEPQGLGYELAHHLGQKMNITVIIHPNVPQARMMNMVREGELDIVAGLAYNPERAKYLLFTRPFYRATLYAFAHKDKPVHLTRKEDLLKYTRAEIRGSSMGATLDKLLRKNTISVNDEAERMALLLANRADYILATPLEFSVLKKHNPSAKNLQRHPLPIVELEARLAISKASPCTKYLQQFNQIIAELYPPPA